MLYHWCFKNVTHKYFYLIKQGISFLSNVKFDIKRLTRRGPIVIKAFFSLHLDYFVKVLGVLLLLYYFNCFLSWINTNKISVLFFFSEYNIASWERGVLSFSRKSIGTCKLWPSARETSSRAGEYNGVSWR